MVKYSDFIEIVKSESCQICCFQPSEFQAGASASINFKTCAEAFVAWQIARIKMYTYSYYTYIYIYI